MSQETVLVMASRRDKPSSVPTSIENIALQDIPENEIVDYSNTPEDQKMIIYSMDDQGVIFPLEPQAQVTDLLPQVIDDMGLSHEAEEIFALWLVSPLLDIQLKPHHSPFRISLQWEDLLIKFTNATEDEISRDEPVLTIKRHAMLARGREKYIDDPKILELLYYESEKNILTGRWPLEMVDYHQLAGLSACVKFGSHDPDIHTTRFYRERLEEVYPGHILNKKSLAGRNKQTFIEILSSKHQEASQLYGGGTTEEKWKIEKIYLQNCWELPYYGASIFRGQIETPAGGTLSRLSNYQDTPVYVAINREGVFVLDKTKVTVLLGLLYREFCWEYAEPSEQNNRNCLPCLFLHFHEDGTNGNKGKTKLLQIFSRQAVMMDALIKSSKSAMMDNHKDRGEDTVDGATGSRHDLAAMSAKLKSSDESSCMSNKFRRLCLATFNAQGMIRQLQSSAQARHTHSHSS